MDKQTGAKRTRRRFPDEFKAGAVRLVLDESRTVGSVARELDLTASALAHWVRHEETERSKGRGQASDEMRVLVIPNKKALGRGLLGQGKKFSPRRDSVRELVTERERET
ncbi:MAG TPA: transposase [Vicinamibacteria bacterium]|nr:transposase [Vicinamibacteria bacterium]